MPGRLDEIEALLRPRVGGALLARDPEMIYTVNQILVRFLRTDDSLSTLWRKLDSALFNAVYLATGGTMKVTLDSGAHARVTSEQIRDLSDRLLSLSYIHRDVCPTLEDALYDLSRDGSFCAMRELAARYPMDETERTCILRVLEENGQRE